MKEVSMETAVGRVHGVTEGSGSLVLGLHGWSQRNGWHTWEPLIAPLAGSGFHVVSVDMPGWGQSPPLPSGQMTPETAVAVVLALLDSLEADSAALLGKSWGGGVALQMALDHPQRVSSLVLSAPAYKRLDRLAELGPPVLLAWAEDDPVIPIHFARDYLRRVPRMEMVTYQSGGHSAAAHNVDDFAPKVIDFLLRAVS
jgi:pimeloyl-ACP methyl ester carboxylesterase